MRFQADAAAAELIFIQSVDPKKPGFTFNNDPECFARYVRNGWSLQWPHCIEEGW